MLFSATTFSPAPSNLVSCSTCHALDDSDPRLLSGRPMHDVTVRPTWWGGSYDTLQGAVSECYVEFMRAQPLPADNEDGRALLVYLESLSPDATAPAYPLTVVRDIVTDPALPGYVPSGNAARGGRVWTSACAFCHGEIHTGAGRLGAVIPIVPEDTITAHGTDPVTGVRPVIIEKVRHGRFFDIGGNMPLFSSEALSDAQLGDLLGYLAL